MLFPFEIAAMLCFVFPRTNETFRKIWDDLLVAREHLWRRERSRIGRDDYRARGKR
jgi:hypothetical protein